MKAYIENGISGSQERKKMENLKFKRRFSQSVGNRAAVVTVPRAIAQLWKDCSFVDVFFDGNSLLITPSQDKKTLGVESL